MITGLLLLAYAITAMFIYPLAGYLILVPAIFLLLLSYYFNIILYIARLGAWIAALWRHED